MATAAVAAVTARHGSMLRTPADVEVTALDLDQGPADDFAPIAPVDTQISEQISVRKRAANGGWVPRKLILTKHAILLSKDEESKRHIVIDSIDLTEIVGCELLPAGPELEELAVDLSRSKVSSVKSASPVLRNSGSMYSSSMTQEDTPQGSTTQHPRDILKIVTSDNQKGKGKIYHFKVENQKVAEDLVNSTAKAAVAAVKAEEAKTRFEQMQLQARTIFHSTPVQMTVLVLILINFFANIAQAEFVPEEGTELYRAFFICDVFLTVCFTIELALNMFGHWFRRFWTDGWSIFDFIVVIASLLALIGSSVPGLSTLRVVRAFRALRIISQLKELRRIVNALAASLFPVVNALLIGAVVNCVFAVVAVQAFGDTSPTHFGTFSLALFTMFVMSLYEHPFNKSDELVIYDYETQKWDYGMVIFFGSFVLIEVWTLLQVMVAVLLDNFIQASTLDRKRELESQWNRKMLVPHPLDPILEYLSTRFSSSNDLDFRLMNLFERIDVDQSGRISYDEFKDGVRKIAGIVPIHLSKDEFDSMVDDYEKRSGRHCAGEELEPDQFVAIMRRQLKLYIQRTVANTTLTTANSDNKTLLSAMKLTMLGEEEHERISSEHQQENKDSYQIQHLCRMVSTLYQSMQDMDQRIRQIQHAVGVDPAAAVPESPQPISRRHSAQNGGSSDIGSSSEGKVVAFQGHVLASDLVFQGRSPGTDGDQAWMPILQSDEKDTRTGVLRAESSAPAPPAISFPAISRDEGSSEPAAGGNEGQA